MVALIYHLLTYLLTYLVLLSLVHTGDYSHSSLVAAFFDGDYNRQCGRGFRPTCAFAWVRNDDDYAPPFPKAVTRCS